jgi:5-methylthioribose kinase
LVRAFWRGYESVVRWQSASELQRAGIGHLAVCLLARVDGTSPAPYLTGAGQKEIARGIGREILTKRPASWDEAVAIVHAAAIPVASLRSATG